LRQTFARRRSPSRSTRTRSPTRGHAAIFAEKKKEAITLKLGNLLPGETATISLGLIQELELQGNAWGFTLPMSFLPDYSKHANKGKKISFDFGFEFKIVSKDQISYLSVPTGSKTEFNQEKTEVLVTGSDIASSVRVFYRNNSMLLPRLLFEEHPDHPDQVAVMASFVPTFEPA